MTADGVHPATLLVNAVDNDAYTVTSTGATGAFGGNGHTLSLSTVNGVRQAGIAFAWNAASQQYVNATFGALSALSFTTSSNPSDVTDISVFATDAGVNAAALSNNVLSMISAADRGTYGSTFFAGSTTLITGATPAAAHTSEQNATPSSVAAIAQSFVGQRWDADGCWLLASTIAAEAGASLPVTSLITGPGLGNGEWFAAYRGAYAGTTDWASTVRAGDVVTFYTTGHTGHVTTCVSGVGASALLVDNADAGFNEFGDGSNDLTILAPHLASQEFDGTSAAYVTVYRLDAPVVTALTASATLGAANTFDLPSQFSAADPAGKAITRYEIRLGDIADSLSQAGHALAAAGTYAVASLAGLSLLAQPAAADSVSVRASNGSFWGDWVTTALVPSAAAPASAPAPIVVATVITPTPAATTVVAPVAAPGTDAVYRFFDEIHGTQFLTSDAAERDSVLASRPDLHYEGRAMGSVAADAADPNVATVFRFFDTTNGTHFFTGSAAERDGIVRSRPDLVLETGSFSEHLSPLAGDTAIYRFFDKTDGSHFFTASASEAASIGRTRPDMVAEGISFYAPA